MSRWARLLGLGLALAAPGARAGELWKSSTGDGVVEGAAFYKPYATWLRLPPALVESTRALQQAVAAAGLPAGEPLPEQVGLSTQSARLSATAWWKEKLELAVAWQATAVISSSQAFAGVSSSTGALGARLATPQRRLVDFSPWLVDAGGFRLQHNLDQLALKYQTDRVTVVLGRQVLSWGTGRLWNPTDVLSPFAPTDVDREVRRGFDALRVSVALGAMSQLELLWLPQAKGVDQGGVVRVRSNLFEWDFSVTAAKYARDLVFGADVAGDVGPVELHAEAAWTLPLVGLDGERPVGVAKDFARLVVGGSWRPHEKWVLTGEYYLSGFGARTADQLVEKLTSERVVRGELFGAGRHYLGLVVSWLASDLGSLSLTTLVNLTDPSVLLAPAFEYQLEQQVLVRAGALLPIGAGPDPLVARAVTAADVLGQTARWEAASRTLGARSEYGLSPLGVFIQVGLYWP